MGGSGEDFGCWDQTQGVSPAAHGVARDAAQHAAHHVEFVPFCAMKLLFFSRLRQGEKEAQRAKGIEIEEP